jgi:Na+-translocating ferredoxin:NAD+ oxidoreductase subunit B
MSHSITSDCTGCTACVNICPVNAIAGERKSLHVIDAAVCIDCGACGRICPSQAVHDPKGELCQMLKRAQWPKPSVDTDKCISCGVCLQACPSGVLDFETELGHRVHAAAWLKDPANCIGCAFCKTACPVVAIVMSDLVTINA